MTKETIHIDTCWEDPFGPHPMYGENPYAKGAVILDCPPRPEPARKPMTEEEITLELKSYGYGPCSEYADGFEDGIRFAEKHHGIGEEEQ